MNFHWKKFLVKIKRLYNIIFNRRNIEEIRNDYFNNRWISKEELIILLEYEEKQFIENYTRLQNQYNDLLSSFNMNSLSNYELLERKYQGSLKK
jgi:hypothetical protein